jgi:hypothetical protein
MTEQMGEAAIESSNPEREILRKVLTSEQGLKNLKKFFNENKKKTPSGEYYDFNQDSCRGTIHRAAATLIFLAYPTDDSTMHLFPENYDENKQKYLFNSFYRACLPADQILFPERIEEDDIVVVINGNDFLETKTAKVENLGVSDLVCVSEIMYD